MDDPTLPVPAIEANEALSPSPAALLLREETDSTEPCPPGVDCGTNRIYKGNEK